MKNFIKLLKGVLVCTLIVVCFCGCGKSTAQYISSEEVTSEVTSEETEQVFVSDTQQGQTDVEKDTGESLLYVYVCGAVCQPGVYMLPEGSRICDLFEAAGGLAEDAAEDYWNQAKLLVDGEMFYVPTKEEAKEQEISGLENSFGQSDLTNTNDTSGKVNLNTATLEQLMGIPGIGESKAKAILAYREEHGGFSSVEEVMQIEGIKEGVFSKMKEYIVVD